MNRLATGLTTGTLLAVAACSSPEQGPSVAELRQYQEALVKKHMLPTTKKNLSSSYTPEKNYTKARRLTSIKMAPLST